MQTLVETPKNLERIAVTWRNLQRHAENSRFTQKLVHIHKNFVETCCARSPDNLYNDIDVDPNDDLKKYDLFSGNPVVTKMQDMFESLSFKFGLIL